MMVPIPDTSASQDERDLLKALSKEVKMSEKDGSDEPKEDFHRIQTHPRQISGSLGAIVRSLEGQQESWSKKSAGLLKYLGLSGTGGSSSLGVGGSETCELAKVVGGVMQKDKAKAGYVSFDPNKMARKAVSVAERRIDDSISMDCVASENSMFIVCVAGPVAIEEICQIRKVLGVPVGISLAPFSDDIEDNWQIEKTVQLKKSCAVLGCGIPRPIDALNGVMELWDKFLFI
eukprot:gnl/Carplike_NY0171/8971_a12477_166.p1 GENE.gnl/Carplike_NY0171/8971_a12477_166~~gnl/Carplike_NY0171/8971_a12477_166.p1  ORF type:complete len:270 (-),score=88.90 gnl/Carplike_NY0171/8971_a12477_166:169-864(-)